MRYDPYADSGTENGSRNERCDWRRITQSIFTDSDTISRFQAELIAEHMPAQQHAGNTQSQAAAITAAAQAPARKSTAKT